MLTQLIKMEVSQMAVSVVASLSLSLQPFREIPTKLLQLIISDGEQLPVCKVLTFTVDVVDHDAAHLTD